jgi:metal-sulfur cluster biosynthetic enzyme
MTTAVITEAQVLSSLTSVLDPELGLSIVDLGLVYGVRIEGGRVDVTMTLTAPGCPLHDVLADWARAAVAAIPGVERCEVALTFDPPWTPDRIRR